jgi:hypothetical protein
MASTNPDGAARTLARDKGVEASPAADIPEGLRYLDEKERALGISLRQLFAEQEHGLRQK